MCLMVIVVLQRSHCGQYRRVSVCRNACWALRNCFGP